MHKSQEGGAKNAQNRERFLCAAVVNEGVGPLIIRLQMVTASGRLSGTLRASGQAMRETMEQLLELQKLQFDSRSQTAAAQAEIETLRQKVPTPINPLPFAFL